MWRYAAADGHGTCRQPLLCEPAAAVAVREMSHSLPPCHLDKSKCASAGNNGQCETPTANLGNEFPLTAVHHCGMVTSMLLSGLPARPPRLACGLASGTARRCAGHCGLRRRLQPCIMACMHGCAKVPVKIYNRSIRYLLVGTLEQNKLGDVVTICAHKNKRTIKSVPKYTRGNRLQNRSNPPLPISPGTFGYSFNSYESFSSRNKAR